MFERPPNGFFVRDLILFNHLRRGGYVAKGFVFEAPDLTNSPVADLNDFQDTTQPASGFAARKPAAAGPILLRLRLQI
jgi:hypothetical protein